MENQKTIGIALGLLAVVGIIASQSDLVDSSSQTAYLKSQIDLQRTDYQRRSVRERDRVVRPAPRINNRAPMQVPVPVAPAPVMEEAPMSEECLSVFGLKDRVLGIIPENNNRHFARLEQRIAAVFNDELVGCMPAVESPVSVPSAPATMERLKRRTNNECYQYGIHTRRYAQCVVNQRRGKTYQGQFYPGR